jgi:hypothetical protein
MSDTLLLPLTAGHGRPPGSMASAEAAAMAALRLQVTRQVAHWSAAVERLADRTAFAAPAAWDAVERYLGVALRSTLDEAVARLRAQALAVRAELAAARTPAELEAARRQLVRLRSRYLQAETLVTFYAHAINCRTSPEVAALLRACDVLATACMRPLLTAAGLPTPPVLVYVDKGLGASILRAGLRLWDGGTISAVAAIKVVWHNLLRPTALTHEAGHQAAFATGWNDELATALAAVDPALGPQWAGWATEIAADAIGFCATGYGSIAALHDVLAGEEAPVFLGIPGDVHPSAWLRVLLGVAFCRQAYGAGPWDDLGDAWAAAHPIFRAPAEIRGLLARSRELLADIAEVVLRQRYRAFGGHALTQLSDPQRGRPDVLLRLQAEVGPALWTSQYWLTTEPLRLLALSTYRIATEPARSPELLEQLRGWMVRLGELAR